MKFLKRNWFWFILLGVLIFFMFRSGLTNQEYKEAIQTKNDSIEVLNDNNQTLQAYFKESQELFMESENDILLYQDSLDTYKVTIYRNRENYETAILDITSIPTDTMYREITRWLDSR